ncbi:uncharacterized protein CDAR_20881 [Caerostris darwini]|uniref:DUF4201 domain-containing protein n=1 Tax=Caerostris darwini TaxID=1538125 RepID=A0AAV4MW88_9ARAC|nr:uncharacterized protein CDAR_20881 [Caerostris darwini]
MLSEKSSDTSILTDKTTSDVSEIGIYKVDLMTDKELKDYIKVLKEESEIMETFLIDPQSKNMALQNCLDNTETVALIEYGKFIQKEIALQQLLSETNESFKDEEKRQFMLEFESNQELARNVLCNFEKVQETSAIQLEESDCNRVNLNDRDKHVENINFLKKVVEADLKEQTHEEWDTLMTKRRDALEKVSTEFCKKYHNMQLDFVDDKLKVLASSWDDALIKNFKGNGNAVSKMNLYFKEIFLKNIKTSVNLKNKLRNLEKELRRVNNLFKDAKEKNKELLNIVQNRDRGRGPPCDAGIVRAENLDMKRLDELIFKNNIMTGKLRQITEERDDIKRKYIAQIRRIYHKADFKSYLTEQMLISLLDKRHGSGKSTSFDEKSESSSKTSAPTTISEVFSNPSGQTTSESSYTDREYEDSSEEKDVILSSSTF